MTSATIRMTSCKLAKSFRVVSSLGPPSEVFAVCLVNSADVTRLLVLTVSSFNCIDTSTCVCNDKFPIIFHSELRVTSRQSLSPILPVGANDEGMHAAGR